MVIGESVEARNRRGIVGVIIIDFVGEGGGVATVCSSCYYSWGRL